MGGLRPPTPAAPSPAASPQPEARSIPRAFGWLLQCGERRWGGVSRHCFYLQLADSFARNRQIYRKTNPTRAIRKATTTRITQAMKVFVQRTILPERPSDPLHSSHPFCITLPAALQSFPQRFHLGYQYSRQIGKAIRTTPHAGI